MRVRPEILNPNTESSDASATGPWAPHWAPRSWGSNVRVHAWVQGLKITWVIIHLESKSSISTHEGWCCGGFQEECRLRKGATKNWQKQSRLPKCRGPQPVPVHGLIGTGQWGSKASSVLQLLSLLHCSTHCEISSSIRFHRSWNLLWTPHVRDLGCALLMRI